MSEPLARFVKMLDAPLVYPLEDFLDDIRNANAFMADCSGMNPNKHLTLTEEDGSEMRITINDSPLVWFNEYFHRHYKDSDEGSARALAVSFIFSFIKNQQAWLEDVGFVEDPGRGVSLLLYRELLKFSPNDIAYRPKKIVRRLKALLREETP